MQKTDFQPLHLVTKPALTTEEAAHYLNRKPQTLRIHACNGTGPVKATRIYGRLAWPTADVKRVLGVA
ncbi:hypothetical protein C5F52_10900 [Limnohabitans sp. TS-CS-82]|uniref:hypothetical protein n=1 Tax=Limnohabitans sp. TS-CS-82 TaxID=2094193 RepID=UPI000CF1E116|nr:hypothetical protein [Limnohabitans sp. TS-CS-82]PQA83203.1 hypothetical protein C5F52_10900 [Limnohabitans sp. TS-CS-82]